MRTSAQDTATPSVQTLGQVRDLLHQTPAACLFACAYFLAAHAGRILSFQPLHFVVFCPPSGLFAGVLLCSPPRRWPLYILAALPANLAFDLGNGLPLLVGLGFLSTHCLEAATGAWLVNRLVPDRPASHIGARELRAIIVASFLLAPVLGAAAGSALAGLALGSRPWFNTWFARWCADSMGVATIGIFLVAAHRYGRDYLRRLTLARAAEFAAALAILAGQALWLFGQPGRFEFKFILIPVLLWLGMRFRVLLVSLAGLVLGVIAVGLTIHASGAGLAPDEVLAHLQTLQMFLGVGLTTLALLASACCSRNRAEDLLRESRERLLLAQEAALAGTWEWDLDSNRCIWSEELFRLFGLEQEDCEPSLDVWRTVIHPDDQAGTEAALQAAIRQGHELNIEWRVNTPDGGVRWLLCRGRPRRGVTGGHGSYVGIALDITERKLAEASLLESEGRYRQAFDNMAEGFAVYQPVDQGQDFMFVDLNPAGQAQSKLTREAAVGRRLTELFPGVGELGLLDALRRVSRSGVSEHVPLRRYEDERIAQWVENYVFRLPSGLICALYEDTTAKKKAEEDLLLAKQAAETANKAKSEFLANMSHELRTPLNGVLGMLQLLDGDPVIAGENKVLLETAMESGRSLVTIVSDILSFAQLDAGRFTVRREPVNLREICDSLCRSFHYEAKEKNLAFVLTVEDSVPETVLTDAGRVRQILLNLMGNSFKFTQRGRIAVHISLLPVPPSPADRTLFIVVSDTGIGIPDENLDTIFEPFTQVDSSLTRKYQGTGIGLALVRQLVDVMGGSVCIDSAPGEGSTVYVTLRCGWALGASRCAGSPAEAVRHFEGFRVLVVEDDKVNLFTALRFLERMGCAATGAGNGIEALKLLAENDFDCILMDIQMPEMDGVEATLAIRSSTTLGRKARIPIIAMTAHAMPGDREQFLSAGMDGYITKPVDMDELEHDLLEIAASAGGQACTAPAEHCR